MIVNLVTTTNASFSLNSFQENFASNMLISKEIKKPKVDELTSKMIVWHASYLYVGSLLLKNAQSVVVEYGIEYVSVIHDRNLDGLSFFRIINVCVTSTDLGCY